MSGINKGFGFQTGGPGGGDTNTNVANADLTSDGNHTLDVAATTLTIDSGATEIMKVNGSSDKVVIGPSGADYTLPVDRGTDGYLLTTSGAGASGWENRVDELEIQAYNDDIDTTPNYFYPVAMSNNKYKSLCNTDLGNEDLTTAISTSAVLRGGYYVVPRAMVIKTITGWGSCNVANTCQIDIVKYTLVDGSSSTVRGASVGTATFDGGESNTVMKALVQGVLSSDVFARGDILMPMIKLNGEVESENCVLYFNLTIELG